MDLKLKAIIENVQPSDSHSVGIPERRSQCHYVLGGPEQSDWFHCGHPSLKGAVYCESHYALCYRGTAATRTLRALHR